MENQWNLQKAPPPGHPEVADYAFELFEISRLEKERLNKPQDFLSNYALYRGQESKTQISGRRGRQRANITPINLYFSNIERTVAVITARNPTGEVVDLDGINDGSETVLSLQLKKWWKDTNQLPKTRHTARTMEVYGITKKKPF